MTHYHQADRIRVGLDATFHNIKTEVFEFRSMVTFEPKDNDCLLHLLWRYQGRMDTYTITALEYLLAIANSDDDVSEWFAQLPPVTYQYSRYTDWIKPYLQSQLVKAEAYSGISSNKELIVKVLSHYDTFEAYLKSRLDDQKPVQPSTSENAEKADGDDVKRKLDFDENKENHEEAKSGEQIDTSAK